jgi:hypothetical protein
VIGVDVAACSLRLRDAEGRLVERFPVSMNVENRSILDMPRNLACLLLPCAVAATAERSPAAPKPAPAEPERPS